MSDLRLNNDLPRRLALIPPAVRLGRFLQAA
jgi:hypothetical protein